MRDNARRSSPYEPPAKPQSTLSLKSTLGTGTQRCRDTVVVPGYRGVGHRTAGTQGHRGARIQGCKDTGVSGDREVPECGGRAGHPPPDQNFLLCPEEEEEEGEGWRLSRCRCPSHRVACGHRVTAEHVDPPCGFPGAIGVGAASPNPGTCLWWGEGRGEREEVSLLTEGSGGL